MQHRGKRHLAKDVAGQIGVAPSTYSLLESGGRRLSAVHVERIARALKIAVCELYGESCATSALEGMGEPDASRRTPKHVKPINTPELREKLLPVLGDQTDEVVQCFVLGMRARKPGRSGAKATAKAR